MNTATPECAPAPECTAELSARFAAVNGRTQLVRKYHRSPLKIAKTFRCETRRPDGRQHEDDQLAVYVMDCSPGLMSGDRYELDWHLERDAWVHVTNQSFTKVHPCAEQGCSQRQTIRLEEGARLEYVPEPIMLYKDASFRSETEVFLQPGSTLLFTDIVCPGRSQRGELFQYRLYANRLKVWYGEQLIYGQRQRIEPAVMLLPGPGSWGSDTHLGCLYVFSDRLRAAHLEEVLAAVGPLDGPRLRCGASLTYKHGLLVSALGGTAWELQRLLGEALNAIRRSLLDAEPLRIGK